MTLLYSHKSRADWGTAQLVREEDGKRTFLFWNGQQRTFGKAHWDLMVHVDGGVPEKPDFKSPEPPPAPEETDMRALSMQTRILGDQVTKNLYEAAITNTPEDGCFGNTGRNLMRDVLEAWLVGEYEFAAPGLAKAIEYLEHGLRVQEEWGDPFVFYRAMHAEALALAHWLTGNDDASKAAFVVAAENGTKYFETNERDRRNFVGSMLLHWLAAGDPQRGLDVANSVPIPKPRAHPQDYKAGLQNKYYDGYGRMLVALAQDKVAGKPARAVHDKAMKYLTKEIQVNLSRDNYSFVDNPKHIVWMKVFLGDLLGERDPKVVIARIYGLVPSVRRPARIAALLAGKHP